MGFLPAVGAAASCLNSLVVAASRTILELAAVAVATHHLGVGRRHTGPPEVVEEEVDSGPIAAAYTVAAAAAAAVDSCTVTAVAGCTASECLVDLDPSGVASWLAVHPCYSQEDPAAHSLEPAAGSPGSEVENFDWADSFEEECFPSVVRIAAAAADYSADNLASGWAAAAACTVMPAAAVGMNSSGALAEEERVAPSYRLPWVAAAGLEIPDYEGDSAIDPCLCLYHVDNDHFSGRGRRNDLVIAPDHGAYHAGTNHCFCHHDNYDHHCRRAIGENWNVIENASRCLRLHVEMSFSR